jgi:uncharacterized membrane protein
MNKSSKAFLNSEREQMLKFKQIVERALEEDRTLVENLMAKTESNRTFGQRIADKVALFGGSWNFIIAFGVVLAVWIVVNSLLPTSQQFDPFPFILMNLILSCIAAIQAPIIMMSQNRQEQKDRERSENDYLINLKAELEVRSLHQKIDLLLEDQIKLLFESQAKQMDMLNRIEHELRKRNASTPPNA